MIRISSTSNPSIKLIQKLNSKNKTRKQERLFAVEGIQENQYALNNGYQPKAFYIQEEIYNNTLNLPEVDLYSIESAIYAKIAYRQCTEGLVGLYYMKDTFIDLENSHLVLILEGIEKPGNLGAIIRSALAFGVDAIVLSDSQVDMYNPNVIRSSVGTVFAVPIMNKTSADTYTILKDNQFGIYGTIMHAEAEDLQDINFATKTAFLFGTEHDGITAYWEDKIDTNYLIPMKNNIDSLNLSNAVAISLFEYQTKKAKS